MAYLISDEIFSSPGHEQLLHVLQVSGERLGLELRLQVLLLGLVLFTVDGHHALNNGFCKVENLTRTIPAPGSAADR